MPPDQRLAEPLQLGIGDRFRDYDTEAVVLADVQLRPDQFLDYRTAGLTAEHFDRPPNRLIWRAMEELANDGVEPDFPAVRRRLQDNACLDEVSVDYLLRVANRYGVPRQRDGNVRAIVARLDAFRRCRELCYGDQRLLVRLAENPLLINNGVIPERIGELEALHTVSTDTAMPILDDVQLLSQSPADFVIDGLLVEQSLIGLVGDVGVGKTYVAIDVGMSIATGTAWLGAGVLRPGPVVYVVAEGAAQFAIRVASWKLAHHLAPDEAVGFWTIPQAVQLLDDGQVGTLIATIHALEPRVVVIDTLARSFLGGEENSARDMGLLIASADRIRREVKTAVCLVHHTNKSGSSARGSGAFVAAVDTMLHLTAADDLLTLTCEKQKDAAPFDPIAIKLVPVPDGTGCIVRLASDMLPSRTLTQAESRALTALQTLFLSDGATATEWQRAIPEIQERTFFRAKKRLVDYGYVKQSGTRFAPTGKQGEFDDLTSTDTATDSGH